MRNINLIQIQQYYEKLVTLREVMYVGVSVKRGN
jgi:hypothetical protein